MDRLLIYPNTNIWWHLYWQQWHHKLYRTKRNQILRRRTCFFMSCMRWLSAGPDLRDLMGKGCSSLAELIYVDRSIDRSDKCRCSEAICMEKIKKSRLSSPHRQRAKSSLFLNACTYYSSVCM